MFIFTRKDTSNQRETKSFRVVFCEKKVFSLKKAHGKLFLAEVTPTLMQYFCSCQPQDPQIEDSGQEDTGEEQKE
jgi:hypothetical protein